MRDSDNGSEMPPSGWQNLNYKQQTGAKTTSMMISSHIFLLQIHRLNLKITQQWTLTANNERGLNQPNIARKINNSFLFYPRKCGPELLQSDAEWKTGSKALIKVISPSCLVWVFSLQKAFRHKALIKWAFWRYLKYLPCESWENVRVDAEGSTLKKE